MYIFISAAIPPGSWPPAVAIPAGGWPPAVATQAVTSPPVVAIQSVSWLPAASASSSTSLYNHVTRNTNFLALFSFPNRIVWIQKFLSPIGHVGLRIISINTSGLVCGCGNLLVQTKAAWIKSQLRSWTRLKGAVNEVREKKCAGTPGFFA